MQAINALLSNPVLTSIADTKVLMAILLAMLAYRLISPVIDVFNPFLLALDLGRALLSNAHRYYASCRKVIEANNE